MSCKGKYSQVNARIAPLSGSGAITHQQKQTADCPASAAEALIRAHPDIFPNRNAALRHLLCDNSTKYDGRWVNGCWASDTVKYIDPETDPLEEYRVKAERPDASVDAVQEYEAMKLIVQNAAALAESSDGDVSFNKWEIGDDSPLVNTPDDISPEWEAAVVDVAKRALSATPHSMIVPDDQSGKFVPVKRPWTWLKSRRLARRVLSRHQKQSSGIRHGDYIIEQSNLRWYATHPFTGEGLWKTSTWAHEETGTQVYATAVSSASKEELIALLDNEVKNNPGQYSLGHSRNLAEQEALFNLYEDGNRRVAYWDRYSQKVGGDHMTITGFAWDYLFANGLRFNTETGDFCPPVPPIDYDKEIESLKLQARAEEIVGVSRSRPLEQERRRISGHGKFARQQLLTEFDEFVPDNTGLTDYGEICRYITQLENAQPTDDAALSQRRRTALALLKSVRWESGSGYDPARAHLSVYDGSPPSIAIYPRDTALPSNISARTRLHVKEWLHNTPDISWVAVGEDAPYLVGFETDSEYIRVGDAEIIVSTWSGGEKVARVNHASPLDSGAIQVNFYDENDHGKRLSISHGGDEDFIVYVPRGTTELPATLNGLQPNSERQRVATQRHDGSLALATDEGSYFCFSH